LGKDVSIAISARDNFSDAITKMKNSNQAFRKDLEGLNEKLDALNKNKVTLKVEADKAKTELKALEKLYEATGNAQVKAQMEMANADYEQARRNLNLVSTEAKNTEKSILNMSDAFSKVENQAGKLSAGTSSGGNESGGILSSLASAGATKMIGSVLSDVANTYVASAYGEEASTMFSSALSSAVSGAAIGSMIAPGIGTAIGAAAGGLLGAVSGAAQVYEKQDAAFIEYYNELYNTATAGIADTVSSGAGIAASRGVDLVGLTTLMGGDAEAAAAFQGALVNIGLTPPMSYDFAASVAKPMLSWGEDVGTILSNLNNLGEASSSLGLSDSSMSTLVTYLEMMKTTGEVSSRYLRSINMLGINPYEAIDAGFGVGNSSKEAIDAILGDLDAAEVAQAIYDYMGAYFAGSAEALTNTYQGLSDQVDAYKDELANAAGEGYIAERSEGLRNTKDKLSGETGSLLQDAYTQIGQWQAYLDNLAEQYEYDALSAVMTGEVSSIFSDEARGELEEKAAEYAEAVATIASEAASDVEVEEAQAAMWRLMAEAQAMAVNEYNASEGYTIQKDANMQLAENLRSDASLNEAYYNAGYELGVQLSKGIAEAVANTMISVPDISGATSSEEARAIANASLNSYRNGNAWGLDYVPYDNYLTYLHEGERVLTASQARTADAAGAGAQAVITGNNFYVREDADIDKIASAFVSRVMEAQRVTV